MYIPDMTHRVSCDCSTITAVAAAIAARHVTINCTKDALHPLACRRTAQLSPADAAAYAASSSSGAAEPPASVRSFSDADDDELSSALGKRISQIATTSGSFSSLDEEEQRQPLTGEVRRSSSSSSSTEIRNDVMISLAQHLLLLI